jgi:hypothetical protein
LRVYFTATGQGVIDKAANIKVRKAELLSCNLDVETVNFNRGFYSVDIRYFYRVTVDAFTGTCLPTEVPGLAAFDKHVILFGSEGNAKIFSSNNASCATETILPVKASLPTAVIEAVDPLCLNVKMTDCPPPACGFELHEVPEEVALFFDEPVSLTPGVRSVYCSLGQFSIIRLERDTQLVIPCYDFCMPEKECIGSSADNPCDLFRRIKFPVDEFFPPVCGEYTDYREMRDLGCK